MWAILAVLLLMPAAKASDISSDEQVVFYTTYAYRGEKPGSPATSASKVGSSVSWQANVHGIIFEQEVGSMQQRLTLTILQKVLDLSDKQVKDPTFLKRAAMFFADCEGSKAISIDLLGSVHEAGPSQDNGQFSKVLTLPAADVEAGKNNPPHSGTVLRYQAVTKKNDLRKFTGEIHLIEPQGLSIISDIDDTVKVSQVTDRQELLQNTFIRKARAVPKMAERYQGWSARGARFHYVSASPWQLYEPISEFLAAEKFPAGPMEMKQFRLKDSSALAFFGSQNVFKTEKIEKILADFPARKFVLIGDSGEQDPEIFGSLARKHPKQIERVFIRAVDDLTLAALKAKPDKGQTAIAELRRYQLAFDKLPEASWMIFQDADELKNAIPNDLFPAK
ncbi:MAG: App1 family protein [Planctomycetota bacterium]|nr:App1 family protein [Planctomycetota bacterium]